MDRCGKEGNGQLIAQLNCVKFVYLFVVVLIYKSKRRSWAICEGGGCVGMHPENDDVIYGQPLRTFLV